MAKIVFLGCGNLVRAIVQGYQSRHPDLQGHHFSFYTPTQTKAQTLATLTGGQLLKSIDDIPSADYYLLGFKPQQLKESSKQLIEKLNPNATLISLLAGVNIEKLKDYFPTQSKFIRLMPNTASMVNAGVTTMVSFNVDEKDKLFPMNLLSAVSTVYELKSEKELDFLMGINASGPALMYRIFESMLRSIKRRDNTLPNPEEFIVETFFGALALAKDKKLPLRDLISQVASKKGVTEKGLDTLEEKGIDQLIEMALVSIQERSKELNKES